jgi:serine protease AprX
MQTSLPQLALTWLAATLGGQQSLESDTGHLRLLTREGTQEIRSKDGDLIRRTKLEVRQLRVIEFPRGDGLVGLWKEGTPGTQHYVVQRAATGFQRSREADYRIHLKGGRFDPLDEVPDCKRPDLTESGNLHLVQFVCPPLAEFRAELEQLGAKVYQFIPAHTRIVRMDEETAIQVKALPFVRWIGPYQANYRLERELLSGLKSSSVDSPIHCSVQVFESGPAQKERVALKIKRLGGRIVTQFSEGYQLQALLDRSQLLQVVALDEVMFIDRVAPREAAMNKVRIAGGANDLESLEGFTGQGVRGEVLDTNVRQTHAAFQHHPLIIHGTVQGSSDHGTKTTGIIFGDGTGEPSARGLLPEGQGIFADFAFLANRYAHTAELLQAPYNAVFQSNSWGSSQTTIYNSTSNQLDNILFDMDITVIQAQGNFGSQASLSQAWSKNVISVGALYHNNTTQLDDDSWSGGASTGPAADGRIKPDLCFWYDSIWTTDNENDTDYDGSFCCTSAATACVAGYVGLVQQMWSEGIFGNFPVGTTVFERRARASTVRALLINSATQYPFNGMNHDRSRTHQGWGIPDVKTLHDNRDSMLIVDESELLSEGGAASYQVSVLPGQSALKATMVFLDPPGTTSASQHRINDLSLKLTAPDSTEYWGNKGLLSGNWSTSGGVSNTIDVIENVFVQNAQAGTWLVEVFADEINQDGHVPTPALDASFALVVSGIDPALPCPTPEPYCTAKLTSTGSMPAIGSTGVALISSTGFTVTVSQAVPQKTALLFWGSDTASIPFQGGTLCVQAPLTRGAPLTTDPLGAAAWALDLSARTPGDQESYQVWFRDPGDLAGFGTGLSNGLTVTYCD